MFNISYGDNSNIEGALVTDMVEFRGGDLTSNNNTLQSLSVSATFGGILIERPAGQFQSSQVDGILGMAYGSSRMTCLPNCAKPPFDMLVEKLHLPDVFALHLQPIDSGIHKGGVLTLGGADYSQYNGSIYYTPIKEESYYVVAMRDMKVGNTSVKSYSTHEPITVVDSGTTFMVVPSYLFRAVKNVFQTEYCHLPHMCGNDSIFDQGTCIPEDAISPTILKAFPRIQIVLEEVGLFLEPQHYMQKLTTFTHGKFYCFGISQGGNLSITILGDTFMKAFYVIFDRENGRLGFMGPPGSIVHVPLPPQDPWYWALEQYAIMLGVTILLAICLCLCMTVVWYCLQNRAPYRGYHHIEEFSVQ